MEVLCLCKCVAFNTRQQYTRTILSLVGLILLLLLPVNAVVAGTAFVIDLKGPIGPADSDFIHRSLEAAKQEKTAVVILRMDTPGGLDTSMRDIIKELIASPIPVIGYVAPGGARAASAGTYILYASHIAAMASGTNLGAATPVSIGLPSLPGQKPDKNPNTSSEKEIHENGKQTEKHSAPVPATTMERKVINDAAAYIRSLAEMRGRNADWAEDAVRKSSSLSAEKALKHGVIDLIAANIEHLLKAVNGRTVTMLNQSLDLNTADLEVKFLAPDWRAQFLKVITNPNIAIILMLIGMYGLVFEFANPGFVLPGVMGAISLILAFYAFETLPVNYAGLGLILLGTAFLIAEAFLPSFGALGLGGSAALVIGLVMLVDTDAPGFGVTLQFILVVAMASVAFFLLVVTLAIRAHRRPVETGVSGLLGNVGEVIAWSGNEGRVRVQGETWSAVSEDMLDTGLVIRVVSLDGLTLGVKPAEDDLSAIKGD